MASLLENKLVWGIAGSLLAGLITGWMAKPPKIVPGKMVYTQGQNVFVPDTLAQKEVTKLKSLTDSLFAELSKPESTFGHIPDTCMGIVAFWQSKLSILKILSDSTANALADCRATNSGKRVFIDTLDGWFVVRGVVPYPVGTISLQPEYLRKPRFSEERVQIGLSFPVFDWPTGRALVRVKGNWWLGVGIRPEAKNGDFLTKYSLEASYSFLRF